MLNIACDKFIGLKDFLNEVRNIVSQNKFTVANRAKNISFMRSNGFTNGDIKNIICSLVPAHSMSKTAEKDRDGYPGWIYCFTLEYEGCPIYIKIRYNPPDEVICISFHENE